MSLQIPFALHDKSDKISYTTTLLIAKTVESKVQIMQIKKEVNDNNDKDCFICFKVIQFYSNF